MILTRKKNIGHSERLDRLTAACADVWCDTVRRFWRTYNNHGVWLSKYAMQQWMCTRTISTEKKSNAFEHEDMKAFAGKRSNPEARSKDKMFLAQNTAQAVVGDFYDALTAWNKNDDERANPPHKMKGHFKASWNRTQIKLRDGVLELQTPLGEDPICIDWPHPKPRRVELGWEGQWEEGMDYELRIQYEVDPGREPIGDKTVGIDLGEKHLAAATDGEDTWLVNGAEVRSLRRYQNKIKAELHSRIDRKERGSRRHRRLVTGGPASAGIDPSPSWLDRNRHWWPRIRGDRPVPIFRADGETYALTGEGENQGYSPIDPIWRGNPEFGGTKISPAAVREEANGVCY